MMFQGSYSFSFLWIGLHCLFMGVALFGFIAALLWLFKHASKKDFLKVVLITLVVGLLGSILTAAQAMHSWYGNSGFGYGYGSEEMYQAMEDYFEENQNDEDFDMEDMMDEIMGDEDSSYLIQ